MEQIKGIWALARENMRRDMSALSFNRWIDVLEPVTIQNGILVIQCPDAATKSTINEYYKDTVRMGVKQANTQIIDVMLILPDQRRDFDSSENTTTPSIYALNPRYTFDTFVVGNSNRIAHAAAQAVAKAPGHAYNPLFLYGGVGLGKTHLMHAIGHEVKENYPTARVLYVTSETFTNELIEAIRMGKNAEFRHRFRNVDLLMIDDVQFIANRQSVQEEFFNTFNTLHNAGKQIVISSDRPPKEIANLEERIRSRLEGGLITDVQEPDIETRIAILRNKAQQEGRTVDDSIIQFIAEHVPNNIRQLEGSLTKVFFYSNLKEEPITMSLAREALKDLLPEDKKVDVNPTRIKEIVADFYHITLQSLMSQRRDKEVVVPRQIAMYLCHDMLSLPYKRIALLFDRSDHTTAISACDRIEKLMGEDAEFKKSLEDIRKKITEG
jgi:chromosomal replication initiator protein DnaA